ncbi:hypothetical protein ACFE04_006518 [Oxalis oulophora]
MDSPQSVVSPFRASVTSEPEKQKSDFFDPNSGQLTDMTDSNKKEFIGVLEVYVHQARDIQNICIYHKQDVYAKLCLTSDPENTVSTKTINGGGQNPVFNDRVSLNVKTIESSLKCEIFMMSRVKNYLEDQLLGFALVPLSEIVIQNGKLEKEFSLSSTDLFHSPAGFVQLSLAYSGASPEVMTIPAVSNDETVKYSGDNYYKTEFPDPQVVNENQMMVSEYYGIQCDLNSESSESLAADCVETEYEMGVRVVESFSTAPADSVKSFSAATPDSVKKLDSPPSSVSTNGDSTTSHPATSDSTDNLEVSKMPPEEHISPFKEKSKDIGDSETESSGEAPKPVVKVSVELPEQNVVQQDIVDMYMKSMQQFTESLAKMKLPLDIDNGPTSSGSSSTDQKTESSKNNGARVFYGSRAFF